MATIGMDTGRDDGFTYDLAAARKELAGLRNILTHINEALQQATVRVDDLEAQIASEFGTSDSFVRPPRASAGRPLPDWKQPGWTPAKSSNDPVTPETLRARREALGISQQAVAHAAHCSRGLVAEVERGKRRSAQTLAHISSTLDHLEKQARRN